MDRGLLVLNSGSSSLKFAVYRETGEAGLQVACRGEVQKMMTSPRFAVRSGDDAEVGSHAWPSGKAIDAKTALSFVTGWINTNQKDVRIVASGHRVVHGGERYTTPTLVDAKTLDYLDGLSALEPSHQPAEVGGIRAIASVHPDMPQVAVFDTSFHRTMPEVSQLYALPKAVRDEGVRHWGFHGISYDYINRALPKHDPQARRVIVGHLGSGASMCAILDGKSIATTMGFSAIEGLPMGTRCGAIDAGALLYLMRRKLYDAQSLERLLYQESGLKGLSEISNDVRTLLASPAPEAKRAIDYFVHRIVYFAGAYAALLGGLDAIVFTAGIGENAPSIRAAACQNLAWLGLELDQSANRANGPLISSRASQIRAWVIPTNEEIMIARHTLALIDGQ